MKFSPLESQEDIFNNSFLSWQKHTKKENTRNREIRCRDDPGKYIAKNSATEGRFQNKLGSESESEAPRRVPGAARRGARREASWGPWSSSPAPLGLGIFLILQKLLKVN